MNTLKVKEQILNDSKGNPMGIFLTMDEYKSLLERIEDLEDTIIYLKAKLDADIEPIMPLREVIFDK
jgi:hypothetical protein